MAGTIEHAVWDVLTRTGGAAMWRLQRELPFDPDSIKKAVTRLRNAGRASVGRAERVGNHWVNVYFASDKAPEDRRGRPRACTTT